MHGYVLDEVADYLSNEWRSTHREMRNVTALFLVLCLSICAYILKC